MWWGYFSTMNIFHIKHQCCLVSKQHNPKRWPKYREPGSSENTKKNKQNNSHFQASKSSVELFAISLWLKETC